MSNTSHKFSILIPGWNAEQYIKNCVNSLLENDYSNFEIILITGGSDNSHNLSLELKEKHSDKIKVLKQEIPNKNRALNLALQDLEGDIIILTDIDCIYQKNWLKKINKIFQASKYNVITGLYLPFLNIKTSLAEYNRINIGYNLLRFSNDSIIIGNKLCGANAAFRKDIFIKKLGNFNESIPTGDDKILGITFNKKGEDLYYFRDIYVYTECYSNNLKMFIKRRVRWAKDLFITLNKKNVLKLCISFGISVFKLFYPVGILIYWLFFMKLELISLILLFLPWLTFFILYHFYFYFQLKKQAKKINTQLGTDFKFKKAFKIVPILFFAYAIITVMSLIYPKRSKW